MCNPIDLSEIPDGDLWREVGRRRHAKRGTSTVGLGRPNKPTACSKCGELQVSVTAAKRHCMGRKR